MIPNIFHFVFGLREGPEPLQLMHYLCVASCLDVNKPDAIVFHYHHEPYGIWWDRIKPHLRLHRIERNQKPATYAYSNELIARYRYAHLSDFVRLEILLEQGGFYADLDTLFIRPLEAEWRKRDFIMGRERAPAGADGSLCNAWLASAPGSRFAKLWLDAMGEAFDGSWSSHSTLLPYRLSRSHPTLLDIMPEEAFFFVDWSPAGLRDLFERKVAVPEQAYSLHLWHHLWGSPERTDLSSFHDGLLTPDYVCAADTTYAALARRFLPPDVHGSAYRYLAQRVADSIAHPLRQLARAAGRRIPSEWR